MYRYGLSVEIIMFVESVKYDLFVKNVIVCFMIFLGKFYNRRGRWYKVR